MSRKSKYHHKDLVNNLGVYADQRMLDLHRYSEYHLRLMDGGYTTVDIWTTGRYYVLSTDYHELGAEMVERGGEKGSIPGADLPTLSRWLDKLFFPEELEDEA